MKIIAAVAAMQRLYSDDTKLYDVNVALRVDFVYFLFQYFSLFPSPSDQGSTPLWKRKRLRGRIQSKVNEDRE